MGLGLGMSASGAGRGARVGPLGAHGPLLMVSLLALSSVPRSCAWSHVAARAPPLAAGGPRAAALRGAGAVIGARGRGGGALRGLVAVQDPSRLGSTVGSFPPSPAPRRSANAFRDPRTALFQAAIPLSEIIVQPERGAAGRPSPQASLLGTALATLSAFVVSGIAQEGGADWLSLSHFASNIPTTVLCFAAADALAQLLEKRASPDFVRMASASLVGIVVNAIGFSFWLHYLDLHIPSELVSLDAPGGMTSLATKALLDSFVWGTTSNTIGIVGRRLLAGDSAERAVKLWNKSIIGVTRSEFAFWPLWQAINFCLVPSEWQVAFTSLGAFTWNTFLSLQSASGHASGHASDEGAQDQ